MPSKACDKFLRPPSKNSITNKFWFFLVHFLTRKLRERQTHKTRRNGNERMLSQFAIIKSYLDERSRRFSYGHMCSSVSGAESEDERASARRMKEVGGKNEITNFRYHMPFARMVFMHMVHHILISTSFFFLRCPYRGLNEIVDNQQFVFFFFRVPSFLPVPKKREFLRESTKTVTTKIDSS